MASQTSISFSTLAPEILYAVFRFLDRPSKLSLALTSPHMLHLLARYYDLDRYRSNPLFIRKISIPADVPWDHSRAQGAIIRWISLPGNDDIDNPPDDIDSPADDGSEEDEYGLDLDIEPSSIKPYEETESGLEEAKVQDIMGNWLKDRVKIEGGVVFCAECYRFMRLRGEDGSKKPWATKMLSEPM